MNNDTKIKLICFDMDGTLIAENSWYKLNVALGVTPEEDQEMYNSYIKGNLEYDTWIENLVSLYKERGLATKENIESVFNDILLVAGAEELVSYLRERGYEIVIITGSFDSLAKSIADKLGIRSYRANTEIVFDADGKLDGLVTKGDEIKNKPGYLKEICDELEISFEECVCIGDGVGDTELFKLPVKGIALEAAPDELKSLSWKVVNSLLDIKELL